MTNKIFRSILSVAAAVLIACFVIITGILYQYFGNLQKGQLQDELSLAKRGTETLGREYLEGLETAHYRLTLVAEDGTVLFDNQVETSKMENHADREEIREAFSNGTGSSSRYSTTLTEENIYEAVRLEDGSILRISDTRASVFALALGMIQPIGIIILLAILLSGGLAERMAKRVVEPLNQLDLDRPLENNVYEELSPLLRRIHMQQEKIKDQMQTLTRKQEEFDQITANMKESLVLLDETGRILSINSAAQKLFGTSGKAGEDFLTMDRRPSMKQAIQEAKTKGEYSFRENREQREYQFELSCIGAKEKAGGIVILGFDVTEQANAEQNRREFTANVSHELKTPLQSIIGSAELLENGIVKVEDVPRFVGHIHKEASRLITLIEDIIRLSQLDESSEIPMEEVSLRQITEEVQENLAQIATQKEIALEIQGDEGKMQGVRRLLYEVVYNLCDNAIKYNRAGGKVCVCVEDRDDMVFLKVSDTGIGIASGDTERIFERFYRVDKSHSKQSGGTGLGLSIVKHAVQYHQGKISVDSRLGEGTTITVLFWKENRTEGRETA